MLLEITKSTIAKQSVRQSSELPENQKVELDAGSKRYKIHSSAALENGHVRVALADDSFAGRNTWVFYLPHIKFLDEQGAPVQPFDAGETDADQPLPNLFRLQFIQDSYLKTSTQSAATLDIPNKCKLEAGESVEVDAWDFAPEGHVKIKLAEAIDDRKDWLAYIPHIEVINAKGKEVSLVKAAIAPQILKTKLKFPGYTTDFFAESSIVPNGHFSWGEATRNGERMPDNQSQVQRIMVIAKKLEAIRGLFDGRPITINSWLRPPAVNKAVGGVTSSRHITGDGVDIVVQGLHPYAVYERLAIDWEGGLGKSSRFTHLDLWGRRRWRYGR